MKHDFKIETDRLLLRPLTIEDTPSVFIWCSDPMVNRFMPYVLYKNSKDVKEWISSLDKQPGYEFGFELKEKKLLIGAGSICFNEVENAYEVGYNLRGDYWGMGFATEACKALLQFAYKELGAHEFCGKYAKRNIASGKVLKKCGFIFDHDCNYVKLDNSEKFDAIFVKLHLD